MENEKQGAFVADEDAAFKPFRAELRRSINSVEADLRKHITGMVENLRPFMRFGINAETVGEITHDVPAHFIRSLLPFFQAMSEMQDQAEILMRLHRRRIRN